MNLDTLATLSATLSGILSASDAATPAAALLATASGFLAALDNYFLAHPTQSIIFYLLLSLWLIVWKGLALWQAAKLQHKFWFIVMLVLNTFGLLEIAYIFCLSKVNWSGLLLKLGLAESTDPPSSDPK
jgi:hypothetical protein